MDSNPTDAFVNQDAARDTPRTRHKKYEQRAARAIAEHRFWDMLWAELARDYNGTVMNILQMWRSVDSHFHAHSRRPPPH